jgi:hypothetical protein
MNDGDRPQDGRPGPVDSVGNRRDRATASTGNEGMNVVTVSGAFHAAELADELRRRSRLRYTAWA